VTGRAMLAPKDALTGTGAVASVAAGQHGVSDLAAASLDRVHERDEMVRAFRVIDEQAVIERAKELDDNLSGPLHGLVVGVKDVIDTADLPTEYGSPLFRGHQPRADADAVATLRRSGALVLGKTESTEFAMYCPTRTRNPADLDRTPGGSSSGSAAAVAAGMVPVALGTQTAGSVIRPAAYCGVYGFKPSRGWTSTRGVWRLAEHLDTLGIFSRSAADLALCCHVLSGQPEDWPRAQPVQPALARHRVAVLSAAEWARPDADVGDALRGVADSLDTAGWDVREISMPVSWRQLPEQHEIVMAVEVARNMHHELGSRVAMISDSAKAVVERGDRCPAHEYLSALASAEAAIGKLRPIASAFDVILAPSALGVAPQGLEFTGDPVMCRPWTLLGLPAANVPAWRRPDELPVGVQAVGTIRNDASFVQILASMEAALMEGD
jgi:Asp-tRNA(Asn)/Glu-tRNA(Gln) amidotransferase A subunit family amidase